jgi:hypothetical protein
MRLEVFEDTATLGDWAEPTFAVNIVDLEAVAALSRV